jgi:hypothetical protein
MIEFLVGAAVVGGGVGFLALNCMGLVLSLDQHPPVTRFEKASATVVALELLLGLLFLSYQIGVAVLA